MVVTAATLQTVAWVMIGPTDIGRAEISPPKAYQARQRDTKGWSLSPFACLYDHCAGNATKINSLTITIQQQLITFSIHGYYIRTTGGLHGFGTISSSLICADASLICTTLAFGFPSISRMFFKLPGALQCYTIEVIAQCLWLLRSDLSC